MALPPVKKISNLNIPTPPEDKDTSGAVFSIIYLTVVGLAGWQITKHPSSDTLPAFGLLFSVLTLIGFFLQLRELKNAPKFGWTSFFIWVLASFFMSVAVVGFAFTAMSWFRELAVWYQASPADQSNRWGVTAGFGSFIFGWILFLFRRSHRVKWGATEIAVGVYIVYHRISSNPSVLSEFNSEFFIALLTAGLYLIVRGFDNIEQGLKSQAEKRKTSKTSAQ